MATLLSICQGAADRIGIPRPAAISSTNNQTYRTLLGCAQEEGAELARRWGWEELLREHTFSATAATVQADGVPNDWDRRMLAGTFWNRSMLRPVRGPLTSVEWQAVQGSGTQVVTDAFRYRAGEIELVPTPTAGWTYAYEYITSDWCEDSGGTGQSAWAADTDVTRLDGELMTLGIVWRFLQGRGQDYQAAQAKYEQEVMKAMARDGSRRVVSLSGRGSMGARIPAVPEGTWAL